MSSFVKNDIIEAHTTRQKKKALKVLKQVIQKSGLQSENHKSKKQNSLESLTREIRLQNMKSIFYRKINKNNIFQQPCQEQILNEDQNNNKRLIKWKGYRLKYHRHFLSVLYLLEMIFVVCTFICSSFMAFIEHFISKEIHGSAIVIIMMFVTMMLCLTKMIVNSTLQKVRKGILLTYVSDIFADYVHSWVFFVDFIYFWIVFILFFSTLCNAAYPTIRKLSFWLFVWSCARLITLNQSMTLFRTTFIDSYKKDQYYKLLKLMIFNVIFSHFVACLLLGMAMIDSTQNWMISKNIEHQNWYVEYMWGFYWATTIITSVGFGDYSAVTPQQAYIVSYLQLFSCIILAYNISEIGNIVYAMRLSQQQYIAKVATFKRMAQQNQTNHELKIRIQSYLRQEKEIKEKFEFNQQNQLLNSLPQPLRKEFILESNGKIFKRLPFFNNLHKYTLVLLAQTFTNKVYYPGQLLTRANQYNDSVMILKEGKVGLVYRKYQSQLNGIVVQQIQRERRYTQTKDGDNIKQIIPTLLTVQFLSPGKVVNYDMNAVTYSYISQIFHQKFLQIIKKNQADAEFYFGIVHSHGSNEKEWFQLPCHRCSNSQQSSFFDRSNTHERFDQLRNSKGTYNHNKFDCPKLHYFPWNKKVIQKYIMTSGELQKRILIYRRKSKKSQSCFLLRKVLFKQYESKRFINEKKKLERLIKNSIINAEIKSIRKRKKLGKCFSKYNNHQITSLQNSKVKKKATFQKEFLDFFSKNKDRRQINNFNTEGKDLIDQWKKNESQQDQAKTMIEEVIKNTMDQVIPKEIALSYWDLQIDLMANYQNYFPHENASRMDNFQLSATDHSKNKNALSVVGSILMDYRRNNRVSESNCKQMMQIFRTMSQPLTQPMQSKSNQNLQSVFNNISIPQKQRSHQIILQSYIPVSPSEAINNGVNIDQTIKKQCPQNITDNKKQIILEEKFGLFQDYFNSSLNNSKDKLNDFFK